MNGAHKQNFPDDDETRIEYGDLDQTLIESQYESPIQIKRSETDPKLTIQIEYKLGPATPLDELMASAMFELNRLNLPQNEEINVICDRGVDIPFGITAFMILLLQKKYPIINVWCPVNQRFETISF